MKQKITLLFFLVTTLLSAQISYKGFIYKYPIELVADIYSEESGSAVYAYSNFDTPIFLSAKLVGKNLVLAEKDKNNKISGKFILQNYNPKNKELNGTWKDINSGKELIVSLTKEFDLQDENNAVWSNREILQTTSLKDKYFKLVLSREKDRYQASVVCVKIFEKKTDKLIQKFDVECQLLGIGNISIDDYNFDGIPDFSVYEGGTAGPDSTSLYFLYDPKTGKYFESSFSGSSLEFDSKTKIISEHNQCCAGRKVMTAEYKVVNNKMVLLKRTCVEFDDKTGKMKKVKCN
ncbi:XAC2610-related protein [Flavobacterium artemisiae]|uniref:XAC2610-related protein n=1 Tax=Flavobacterium artemisiae TaxID=2126556 RepID=A0ABW4HK59_9FLAO